MSWTERTVIRDGVRLRCQELPGPGPALVLMHGLAGHAGEWEPLAAALAGRHRLVAFDQRGHGASERRPADLSRAAFVADTVAVVEQLGLERPVLVGQSLGGHTALLTAAAHPGLLGGLVLVDAGPGRPDPGTPELIGGWLDSWPVPFPSREAAVEFLGGGPVGQGWADGLQERDGRWWPRFDRDVMVGALAENARLSYWDEWSAIDCPSLVVLAQRGIIPAEDAEAMPARNPLTAAVCLPDTGHDVHLERPRELAALLLGFLAELPGAGAGAGGDGGEPDGSERDSSEHGDGERDGQAVRGG